MEPTKSQSWKPLVYMGVTIGGVAGVLGVLYLLILLINPRFSLVGMSPNDGKLTLLIAGVIAYGTVIATTRLLKKYYGREFGTYLDDADAIEPGPAPSNEKLCARCGSLFAALHNDFHAAGFCSRACREAFGKRR
jgi:hypothetical protein